MYCEQKGWRGPLWRREEKVMAARQEKKKESDNELQSEQENESKQEKEEKSVQEESVKKDDWEKLPLLMTEEQSSDEESSLEEEWSSEEESSSEEVTSTSQYYFKVKMAANRKFVPSGQFRNSQSRPYINTNSLEIPCVARLFLQCILL